MLMNLSPTAAQLGQTSEHTVESRYSMFGANQVLVSGEVVTGEVVTPMELDKDGKEPALTQIKLKFTVAAEAMPGVRDFRIIGPTGPSTIGQIVITRDPVIVEDPKNDTQETALAVTIPSTLCGFTAIVPRPIREGGWSLLAVRSRAGALERGCLLTQLQLYVIMDQGQL